MPRVYDFGISKNWHQIVLWNEADKSRPFIVPIAGDTVNGTLGLEEGRDYYLYDFWNDRFAGRVSGKGRIEQSLRAGEARMLSLHAVEQHPQWISTDRHIMQGYVDFVRTPTWDAASRTLCGVSEVVAGEPYRVTMALNGFRPLTAAAGDARCSIAVREDDPNLADLVIETNDKGQVEWTCQFAAQNAGKQ
jgi:hypothetical protein